MTPERPVGRPASRPAAQNVPSPGSRSAAQRAALTGPSMLPVAEYLIAKGRQLRPVAQYASPEWHALPVGSPRWLAAVLVAAEAWRTWTDPAEVAWRLRVEIDAAGRDDDEPALWSPEIVAQVHRAAGRPTHAKVSDRRGEPEKAARARWHERRMRQLSDDKPTHEVLDDETGARSHALARHIDMSPSRGPRTRTVAIEVGRRSAWITATSVASILDELRAPRMWCPFHRCPAIPVDYVGDLLAVLEYRDRRWVTVTAVDR